MTIYATSLSHVHNQVLTVASQPDDSYYTSSPHILPIGGVGADRPLSPGEISYMLCIVSIIIMFTIY